VDVLAGRDVLLRAADDLVVAAHRLAGADRARRDLVPGRNEPGHDDPFVSMRVPPTSWRRAMTTSSLG
jgi:hypothetical protein